ncbi:hypothetical protein BG452_07525 [Streptomyces sp. CBMA123]|nr:hypothetical protein [Streptomyces sp. CBMA123]
MVISAVGSTSPAADQADATWIVRTGLADSSCLTFESAGAPVRFLRHYAFELSVSADDGGSLFTQDATFCPTAGNSGAGVSLRSVNYPTKYVRHYDYKGYVAADGGSNSWDATASWAQDTSWLTASPWR